jgi:hypothetical protein
MCARSVTSWENDNIILLCHRQLYCDTANAPVRMNKRLLFLDIIRYLTYDVRRKKNPFFSVSYEQAGGENRNQICFILLVSLGLIL